MRTAGPIATATALVVTEWRVTATNALLGYFVGHTGSLPGTRSFYQLDDVTPMNWVVTLNTSPDWDYGSCSSATTVPAATKYWCLLRGNSVSENNGATVTSASTTNSIFTQMRAIYGNATKRRNLKPPPICGWTNNRCRAISTSMLVAPVTVCATELPMV